MKILFAISHLSKDGPVDAVMSIIKGLHEVGGHEVVVLTLSDREKDQQEKAFLDLGVRLVNIPVKIYSPFQNFISVRSFLNNENFDFALSNCVRADFILGWTAPGQLRPRMFSIVHNIPSEDLGFLFPSLLGRLAAWVHYKALRLFGNRVICVSFSIRDHLRREIGAEGVRILNPIRLEPFTRDAVGAKPVIVYAASLSARKNPGEAIDFVLENLPPNSFRYEIYGRGPLEDDLRERFRGREELKWEGFTDKIFQVFSRANVYVSSSFSEGLPLTPQKALICGCPCVLSDIPQHRELSMMSSFVYLYRLGDTGDFNRALKLALNSDHQLALLEGAVFAERTSPHVIAKEYLKLLNFYNEK